VLPGWRDLLKQRHVLIISGGYGLVLGAEPIGDYNATFRTGVWPARLISCCLVAYAARHRLTTVVGFAAASTDYAKPLRRASWPHDTTAWLLSPSVVGGGAPRRAPTAIGQAVAALVEYDTLDSTWHATDDMVFNATRLR
jgi:hypothetical protein